MSEQPWYHNGLKFRCTGCGDCCTGAPGYVWVNKSEIEAMAATLRLAVDEFQRRYVRLVGIRRSLIEFSNGDCVFLDPHSRRCQVYQVRPRQCRTWPFWVSNLSTPESWRETCDVCPGTKRGPVIPLDEIVARMKVMNV